MHSIAPAPGRATWTSSRLAHVRYAAARARRAFDDVVDYRLSARHTRPNGSLPNAAWLRDGALEGNFLVSRRRTVRGL
jgi:hypothetical protein